MKRKAKNISSFIFVLFLVVLCVSIIVFGFFKSHKSSGNSHKSTEKRAVLTTDVVELMQNSYLTDLIIYGDDIPFEINVPSRKIDSISKENLNMKQGCSYAFLVINDLSHSVHLSEKEIKLIGDEIKLDNYCLLYLGDTYAKVWEEEGDYPVNVPDNYSYQYYRKDGEQNVAIGAWSKQEIEVSRENPNLLGDVILYQIDFFWRDVNHMREC